jgi:hypothetical protein
MAMHTCTLLLLLQLLHLPLGSRSRHHKHSLSKCCWYTLLSLRLLDRTHCRCKFLWILKSAVCFFAGSLSLTATCHIQVLRFSSVCQLQSLQMNK